MMPMGFEYGWARPLDVVANGEVELRAGRVRPVGLHRRRQRNEAAMPALNEEGPQRRLSRPDDPLVALLRRTRTTAPTVR